MTLCPSSDPLRVPLPAPPESSLPEVPDPESDRARGASPTVSLLIATAVIDPCFESSTASALVAELLDFAVACRIEYATALVAESESACPPSVGGECASGTDVLEDRQEEFECITAAVPRFASMLLAPEGDPDAPDIPTPRSYAEAITGPYSSQWQAAMDAEMASWKSTGTYVDEVPPPGVNIVDGMWIFRVKRPLDSPPAFKARYVASGFSKRQGVDSFQTFSPTPKMTSLRVLLHVAAQRDYELHFLDLSTAFLQGSLHKEIWLRRPPGFTGSFPVGTQWSLRRPVYGLHQAPREWHDTLKTTLAAPGFAPSTADPSLFLRTDTSLPPFYVLVYVDDLVFATADTKALTLVLQRFGFQFSSPQPTPLSTSHSLSAPPLDESVEPSGPYPELVGCLKYLMTCTRPDLAYPLSLLARYVAPGRHQKELRWLTYLLTDLGEHPHSPPVLYVDNKAMIAWCQEHILEHRTKHITLRYFIARELQQHGQLRLAYVATRANSADIFTKALPPVGNIEAEDVNSIFGVGSSDLLVRLGRRGVVKQDVARLGVGAEANSAVHDLRRREKIEAHVLHNPHVVQRDLKLYLGSRLEHAAGALKAPPTPAPLGDNASAVDQTVYAQRRTELRHWAARDNATILAITTLLPPTEQEHFVQEETAHALMKAMLTRYSTPVTANLGRHILPFLFRGLPSFARVADLILHLRSLDAQFRAAFVDPALLAKNTPPMYMTLSKLNQVICSCDQKESRSQQRVQLQPQQEREEEEPQERQHGQVPSQQTPEEAEQQRLRLRNLPDPASARLVRGPLLSPPVPLVQSLSLSQWTCCSPLTRAVSPEPRRSRYRADGPFHLVLRSRVPPSPILLQPPESSLTVLHDPLSDYLCASRLVVSRVFSALATHPTAPLSSVSALVTTVVDFASSHRLDYAAHIVSGPARSPSSGGAPVFLLEVLEDRQFELGFLAAAFPHLCTMLLAPEGDPHALDIPIPRTHADAVSGYWASYWIAAEEAEMASYRSTGTYVDAVPPPRTNIEELQRRHTCADLGELQHYLGLQITGDRAARTITLTQSHMVEQIITRFRFPFSKVQLTPLGVDHGLTAPPLDKPFESSGSYPELVGCLMYVMTCMGLVLGGKQPATLIGFSDLSGADDAESLRSTQGYCFSLGIGAVSWRSTRASSVSSSSCEAEVYAAAMAAQELCWLIFLLTNLGERPRSPPVLFADNRSAILMCEEPRLVGKAKHIQLCYFLLCELQQRG
ncbi:unnamed protein product [Closterium sp. NIES-54]